MDPDTHAHNHFPAIAHHFPAPGHAHDGTVPIIHTHPEPDSEFWGIDLSLPLDAADADAIVADPESYDEIIEAMGRLVDPDTLPDLDAFFDDRRAFITALDALEQALSVTGPLPSGYALRYAVEQVVQCRGPAGL